MTDIHAQLINLLEIYINSQFTADYIHIFLSNSTLNTVPSAVEMPLGRWVSRRQHPYCKRISVHLYKTLDYQLKAW